MKKWIGIAIIGYIGYLVISSIGPVRKAADDIAGHTNNLKNKIDMAM